MKVAVLFTGALRTIKKTMRYFKQNVLLDSDVDVFACVQNDTATPNLEWESWLGGALGEHLKTITWFSIHEHQDWASLRDKLMSHLNLVECWKNYITTSGSMVEYYQLYLAYLKMCSYEDTHQRYKYIIRVRTDTIFAKPIDFHWLLLSDSEVEERIRAINCALIESNIEVTPQNTLSYFMSTIISDRLIPNIQNILTRYIPNRDCVAAEVTGVTGVTGVTTATTATTVTDAIAMNEYIKTGAYILTIRANNLYIVSRELFNTIPTLSHIYGFLKSPHNDDYWFNAENQFQSACYFSGLAVFDYNTLFEDKSLYEYDEKRYFDMDFNVLNPYMLYCLVRY
jgi:hypothetical protein